MPNDKQYEMEEDDINRREAEGLITPQRASIERKQLARDYREDAEESAQQAYRQEMDRW